VAIVVFDPNAFKVQYPEFAGISSGLVTGNFNIATLYCNNTDASIVTDIPTRTTLLWLLTAHVTKLYNGTNDGAGNVVLPSDVVGRISTAKEGTVEVISEMGPPSASAAWYNQTRYGAAYWAATVKFRSFNYVPYRSPAMNLPGSIPAIWPFGRY
jgi:hypothetical protein